MSQQVEVRVNNNWGRVIREFADSRGVGYAVEKAVFKAAQLVVSYALKKEHIPVADREKIRARLMAPASRGKFAVQATKLTKSGKESRTARYRELRNSLAAYLVQVTNYKNARSKEPAQFYGIVGRYISARVNSAGYHRSGLIPAARAFRVGKAQQGAMPRFWKNYPGTAILPNATDDVITARLTNFARAIETLAAGAFVSAESEAMVTMQKYTQINLAERLAKAGLTGRK